MITKKLSFVRAAIILAVCALLIIGALFVSKSDFFTRDVVSLALYENGSYVTYDMSRMSAIHKGVTYDRNVVQYPSGRTLSLTSNGVEVNDSTLATPYVLIERKNISPSVSSLASDGSRALIYNPDTRMLDVFDISYQGAQASYLTTLPGGDVSEKIVSAGFLTPTSVVLHLKDKNKLEVYELKEGVFELSKTVSIIK